MPSLSVIIITKNEENNIRKCLESVKWADEIIVLDSGSTDNTVPICREYTVNVIITDWPGYGPQKNRALSKASKEWVFSIDADEWMTKTLQTEITHIIQTKSLTAYAVRRRNIYWGHMIQHGEVGNDWVIRLFKRGHAKFTNDLVHERIIPEGKIGKLKQSIHHNTYTSFEDLLARINTYTTISAKQKHEKGEKAGLTKIITHSLWAFLKSYVIRSGWRDGRVGFLSAISSAESCYYRYAKLWLLNKKLEKDS